MKVVLPCLGCQQETSIDGTPASCVDCLRARVADAERKLQIVVRALSDPVSISLGELELVRSIARDALTGAKA